MSSSERQWRCRLAPMVATVLIATFVAACGSGDDGEGGSGDDPLVIGLATAESGPIALYDQGPNQAIKVAVDEINADGGINGQQIEIIEGNTQSDKALATNVANDLISQGANVLVVTCDFDYGSPAATAANAAQIPALSACGSDPKLADTTTLGEYVFTFAPGTDAEATAAAEWAYERQGWRSAYILQDQATEYTKSLGRYFVPRWEELGGAIVGTDSYQGGDNVNIKTQVTAMGADANGADFIYLPGVNPGAATAIRQIRAGGVDLPILSDAAIDGDLTLEVAGNVSDVYPVSFGCFDFCTGNPSDEMNKWADTIAAEFGEPPAVGSSLTGDTLVRALVAAVEEAGSTNGDDLIGALEDMPPIETLAGEVDVATPTCHKPSEWPLHVQRIEQGKIVFEELWPAKEIPDIGDGNGCATQ